MGEGVGSQVGAATTCEREWLSLKFWTVAGGFLRSLTSVFLSMEIPSVGRY